MKREHIWVNLPYSFSDQDFFVKIAKDCKLTLIGKFSWGKPKKEEEFHESKPTKGDS